MLVVIFRLTLPLLFPLYHFLIYYTRRAASIHVPPTVTALPLCRLLLTLVTLFHLFLHLTRLLIYPSLCLPITHLSVRLPLRHYYWLLPPRLPLIIRISLLLSPLLTRLPLIEPPPVLDTVLPLEYVPLIRERLDLMPHLPSLLPHLIVLALHLKQPLS